MTIKNLHWELEATFTRKQVIAMARIAEFVGNIKSDLTKGFPSSCKDIDWDSVREVMSLFANLGVEDTLSYRALCKSVNDVNTGKIQILCGKVMTVEEKTE